MVRNGVRRGGRFLTLVVKSHFLLIDYDLNFIPKFAHFNPIPLSHTIQKDAIKIKDIG